MKRSLRTDQLARIVALVLFTALLVSCVDVDLEAAIPIFETGVNPDARASIPVGEFLSGQHNEPVTLAHDYEIMVTNDPVAQYVTFLNAVLADGKLKVAGDQIIGFYPGDKFHAVKHEIEIAASDYIVIPLNDPASRFSFDGAIFYVKPGYENHPMTNVSWFGAGGYCGYHGYRLPIELEWEKAARGSADDRPFPWGDEIARNNANFYASRDPFEDMGSFGSRTSPVAFYNGKSYDGYQTLDSASPHGLYDMADNAWQWTSDVVEVMQYRFMRGGEQ